MRSLSPQIWVRSLTYGVSPQPAHAPENSNSGLLSWLSRSLRVSSFAGSTSGRLRKNFQFSASVLRSGICSTILSAPFAFIGHWTTQSSQPMQSSGATWIVTFSPNFEVSLPASTDLNVAGALASSAAG